MSKLPNLACVCKTHIRSGDPGFKDNYRMYSIYGLSWESPGSQNLSLLTWRTVWLFIRWKRRLLSLETTWLFTAYYSALSMQNPLVISLLSFVLWPAFAMFYAHICVRNHVNTIHATINTKLKRQTKKKTAGNQLLQVTQVTALLTDMW